MKLFKIVFLDSAGFRCETVMGEPISNDMDFLNDFSDISVLVQMVFSAAYPDCKILSCESVDSL